MLRNVVDQAVLADRVGVDAFGIGEQPGFESPQALFRRAQGAACLIRTADGLGQRPSAPEDFAQLEGVLNDPDDLRPGAVSRQGNPTVVATKAIGGETFRAVWEVLAGKRNRSLQLTSIVIKTAK